MSLSDNHQNIHHDSPMPELDALMRSGVHYYALGDFINAEKTFIEALNNQPQRVDILISLAKLYYEWKRFPEALNYIMAAVRIEPGNLDAWHGLSQIAKISNNQQVHKTAMEQISLLENRKPGQEKLALQQDRFIVFVADRPRARDAKLAWGLKQNGWNVILLYKEKPEYDPTRYFSEIRQYHNTDEALQLASLYQPAVFHVFSIWLFNTAYTFIQNKPGKVIFDDYDVMAGMMKTDFLDENYPGQLEMERFCLENADGICCRSPQTQYARHQMGYQFSGKRLLLVDGCWGLNKQTQKPLRKNQDFHIVYCGNLGLCDDPTEAGKCELLEMAEILAANDIHFHIYPSYRTSRDFEFHQAFAGYFDLQNRSPFFHFHESVSPDLLISELSQYDAGWFDYSPYAKGYHRVYQEWMYTYYAATNKIFDYLDAGLPVIINSSWFIEKLLKQTGTLVKITPDFLKTPREFLDGFDWETLQKNAKAARDYFDTGRQTRRLIKFYQCLE